MVKEDLWSIEGNKVSSYNGYISYFFKDFWIIVGNDFCNAVLDFFYNWKNVRISKYYNFYIHFQK